MSKSPVLFSSDDEDEGHYKEAQVLKKFQIMLQGVPPPSSVTMSKLSVSDMLQKYKENECSFSLKSLVDDSHRFKFRKKSTPLVCYSNLSQSSEEIANLLQKVQSRYIYAETMSSCNIWFDTIVKTNSAKKQSSRRNGFRLSPGSRLSHLARRRQVFSCENLQQLANSDKRRHIEIKKESALKTKTLERNKTVESIKTNSFKRALFLSPDDEDTKNVNLSSYLIKRNLFPSSDKRKTTQDGSSKASRISEQLFNQNYMEGSSKKRRRIESRESNGNWPRKALTFSEEDSYKTQESDLRNAKVLSEVQLSLHHKSKLLWAVSVTLKENNISSKDPMFKTCASALFMICRKNLGKILNSEREGGTSEKMIHFAREHIGGIFKKLGISKDGSGEHQSKEVPHVESSSNFESCSERTKEILDNCKESVNDAKSSESSLNLRTFKVQTNNYEKENIDVSENKGPCPRNQDNNLTLELGKVSRAGTYPGDYCRC